MDDQNLDGFNVTVPYKESIIPFLDDLDETSKKINSVNCVKKINGKWIGFNTDAFGFKQCIKPFLESHHERALILGTGGAAKAVEFVLNELGIAVFFLSRNPKNENQFGYSEVNQQMIKSCGVIIHTTPVGMFPRVNECVEFPFEFLTESHLLVDLIYNPNETEFLKRAKSMGASAINGETMLFQQAEKTWEIWNS